MAEPFAFSPDELDRIEDALEQLEEGVDVDDLPQRVRDRLTTYRDILIASRDALLIQDVPSGLLDRVMQEAHAATVAEGVLGISPVPEHPELRPSRWTRWKRTLLIPGVAVVGTAALVLVIVQPTLEDEAGPVATTPRTAPADVQQDGAVSEPEAAAVPPMQNDDHDELAREEGQEEPAAEPGELLEIATSRAPDRGARDREDRNAGAAAGVVAGAEAKPSAPPPKKAAELADDKGGSPRWDLIARGDRARRDGDCGTGRIEYQRALATDDARVQARANAGLGLCEASDEMMSAARSYYDRARELDPEVGRFIEAERPGGSSEASPKKRSSVKSKTSTPNAAPQKSKPTASDDAFE